MIRCYEDIVVKLKVKVKCMAREPTISPSQNFSEFFRVFLKNWWLKDTSITIIHGMLYIVSYSLRFVEVDNVYNKRSVIPLHGSKNKEKSN